MRGFTLVELIIVLVVVGILAVSASPLFVGTDGDESKALREQSIGVLRHLQTAAMQNTSANGCSAVYIGTSALGRPTNPSCSAGSYSLTNSDTPTNARVIGYGDSSLTMTTDSGSGLPVSFKFNGLGQPVSLSATAENLCDNLCQLTFTEPSGASASACINAEGFIQRCS